jgi:protein-tyrosine phosphatase
MVDPYRIGRALNTEMHQVNNYLYIGNRRASENIKALQAEGIVKILQLLDFYIPFEKNNSIEVHFIQMQDSESQNLSVILPEALRYIHIAVTRGHKILIHCNAGVSRSGSVLIAYLMASLQIDYKQALSIAQEKRACISPNPGFVLQLRALDLNYLRSLIN